MAEAKVVGHVVAVNAVAVAESKALSGVVSAGVGAVAGTRSEGSFFFL